MAAPVEKFLYLGYVALTEPASADQRMNLSVDAKVVMKGDTVT